MLSFSRQQRKLRIRQLIVNLEAQKEHYYNKSQRARSEYRHDYYWQKYKIIRDQINRYYLSTLLHINHFGEVDILQHRKVRDYILSEKERIEKGKAKFQNTHYYAPWFYSTSVYADYGTYKCDRCNHTFYHSPSKITKAAKTIYACCCGYCTNEIISRDS